MARGLVTHDSKADCSDQRGAARFGVLEGISELAGRGGGRAEHYEAAEVRITDPGLTSFNKAAALYRLGRYGEAERHYRTALELHPKFQRAYYSGPVQEIRELRELRRGVP